MPITRYFVESCVEDDSNVYNVTCSLDALSCKEVIDRIIVDYVLYLIGRRGHYCLRLFPGKEGRTELHRTTQYIMQCLVKRGAEFERAFLPRFENREAFLLKTPENAELAFKQTLDTIWSDGQANWGRFLAYISFVGAYCLAALNAGTVFAIKFLVEAAVDKLDSHIGGWIKRNGGWRVCYLQLRDMNLIAD